MRPTSLAPPLLAGLTSLALALPASATVFYRNDFQSPVGSEWSRTETEDAPTAYWFGPRSFLGQFGNDTVTLSLNGLGGHDGVTLEFDLYLLRSWDGSSGGASLYDYGNDVFRTAVQGGPVLLEETFSNGNPAGQTFGPAASNPAYTGASETYSLGYVFDDGILGVSQVMDAVYRFSFSFAHTDGQLALDFGGSGLQGLDDESWGLDNVRVSLHATPIAAAAMPAPAVVPLLGAGFVGLLWARRGRRLPA